MDELNLYLLFGFEDGSIEVLTEVPGGGLPLPGVHGRRFIDQEIILRETGSAHPSHEGDVNLQFGARWDDYSIASRTGFGCEAR